MCFSLAQLCFVDEDLAKTLWISLLPDVWSLFNDDQRNLLSARAIHFLANSKLRNNFMTVFYEAIILCKPNINFKPYVIYHNLLNLLQILCIYDYSVTFINIYFSNQMVYIGKTYNLWHLVIKQMEDICSCYIHDKKDVSNINKIHMFCSC